ncbi:MAG: transglutaminase-like domain-containing protein, partial [Rickettsiales bacterium]|nr:transglutaminase-like domain-containing protein [Rickettsiales bacterium]
MFGRFRFFFLFFAIWAGVCRGDLVVKNWQQNNVMNDQGQEITINLELEAKNLSDGHYYSSWSYIFGDKSNVLVREMKILDNHNDNGVEDGEEKITFRFRKLFNGQSIGLSFKYQEINDELKILNYIRHEWVMVPKWVEGKVALRVEAPKNLDVYSLNEKFVKKDNVYTWNSPVSGGDGFRDVFWITKKKARWEVSTRVKFTNDLVLQNIRGKIPMNFVGGNNNIVEYAVYNNQVNYLDNDKIKKENDFIIANFRNFNAKSGFIEIRSILENNYNNFHWLENLDMNTILKIDPNDEVLLRTLAYKIVDKDKSNLPLYVKIGKWVYNNIKYDLAYFGKNIDARTILKEKRGVCEHYAVIYQNLLRAIGIPAQIVSGLSYNFEKKTFENHAWVILNHNSQWLPMDPTWNIFSGKLPISHIFMFNYIRTPYSFFSTEKMQ